MSSIKESEIFFIKLIFPSAVTHPELTGVLPDSLQGQDRERGIRTRDRWYKGLLC